jgi:hypothetical protein
LEKQSDAKTAVLVSGARPSALGARALALASVALDRRS